MSRSARTFRCSASCRPNPTSRNTFPVDGVTLSFMASLFPPLRPCGLQQSHSTPGDFEVAASRLLRSLLEGVKNVHGVLEPGYVEHSMRKLRSNPNLSHAEAQRRDRLPIVGVQA